MKKKKSSIITTIVMVFIFLLGLAIMLYPTVSNWWNTRVQSRAIASYQQTTNAMSEEEYNGILFAASDYNSRLAGIRDPLYNFKEVSGYTETLDVSGTGIMGYISIPVIGIELPIYHGTSDEVLNIAVGHLEGSSLPVGGSGTHSVVMAHRGLPSAKLFSDLDELVKGDTFTITILNETLTYEVEDIFIILPHEFEKLEIVEGKDYVTLMTCTPYGINSHRLLVRGTRIGTVEEGEAVQLKVPADATQVDPMVVVPIIAVPLVLILIIMWSVGGKKKKKPAIPTDVTDI